MKVTNKGKTINESLLKCQALSKSNFIIDIVALVIPQPKHSVPVNLVNKHGMAMSIVVNIASTTAINS